MTQRLSTIREVVVPRSFRRSRLPAHLQHLDCYFLIQRRHVLIESSDSPCPISVFCREDGRLVCSCPQAREWGICKHEQALENGLWARLASLPRCYALLTCTADWCQPHPPYTLSLAPQLQQAAPAAAGGG